MLTLASRRKNDSLTLCPSFRIYQVTGRWSSGLPEALPALTSLPSLLLTPCRKSFFGGIQARRLPGCSKRKRLQGKEPSVDGGISEPAVVGFFLKGWGQVVILSLGIMMVFVYHCYRMNSLYTVTVITRGVTTCWCWRCAERSSRHTTHLVPLAPHGGRQSHLL